MSIKLKTASGSITLAPEDGSGDVSVTIPRAGVMPTKSTIDALGIAATSVTGSQASAITANTAKTGITSGQASAISANTAKVGITTGQASAISANTAKVTNSTDASDLVSGTLADARFPATLPAISGANLTNLPAGGATSINGLTDGINNGSSVGLGTSALSNTTGTYNTAVGHTSLEANTSGSGNTAVGWRALKVNISGEDNVAVGMQTLDSNTSGYNNSAVGKGSLQSNTTGSDNAGSGKFTLYSNTTGFSNTAVGADALRYNTTGYHNTAVGKYSLGKTTTSQFNTASGYYSLYNNTTGAKNIGIGHESGLSITTGSNNTVIGSLDGTAAMAGTVLIGAGSTERLKIDSTGLYVNGSATALGGGGGVNITSNATAPTSPTVGDQWYDTANGVLYVRVTDGTDAAWLDISSANGTAAAAAAGGGGAWEVVSSTTVTTSGVQSIEFTGLDSTYEKYVVHATISTATDVAWKLQYGNTTSYPTTNSDYTFSLGYYGTYVGNSYYANQTTAHTISPSIHAYSLFTLLIDGIGTAGKVLTQVGFNTERVGANQFYSGTGSGYYKNIAATVIDRLKMSPQSAQDILTGSTFTLYGIKSS